MEKAFVACPYRVDPDGFYAEKIRSLRASIMHKIGMGCKSILVTSCWKGEGKSSICLNLAIALGELGTRTLLLDCDLRNRGLSNMLATSPEPSPFPIAETTFFMGHAPGADTNPADTLMNPTFQALVKSQLANFDFTLIDSPALSACNDALILGTWTSGALLVSQPGQFEGIPEGHFSEDLRDQGIEVIGVVINGTKH